MKNHASTWMILHRNAGIHTQSFETEANTHTRTHTGVQQDQV